MSIVQRLIGGHAAESIAKKQMKTVLFFFEIPRYSRTVFTSPPRTKMATDPAPVRAPGISIRTPMIDMRTHLLLTFSTTVLVMAAIAPLCE